MSQGSLLQVFAREVLGPRTMPRGPVPLAVLTEQQVIGALEEGGRVDGRSAAGYLYQTAQITRLTPSCRNVLDLGCGAAVQLLQVAELNPGVRFIGVDRSRAMLASAAAAVRARGLGNLCFLQADITDLRSVGSASVDAVISTMTLHHLTDVDALGRCFSEIGRVLKHGGAIYLEDFGRMKAERSVRHFVARGLTHGRDTFSDLYEASMRADFLASELRAAARAALPKSVEVYTTFPVPFLWVAKTRGSELEPWQARRLAGWLEAFDAAQRRDYRDLALALKLGGLRDAIPDLPRAVE